MDDAKEYEEFNIGHKYETSAEIAEVIIILGYATHRSKEVTGKSKRVILPLPACWRNQHWNNTKLAAR